MSRQFVISVVALFVASMLLGWGVHAALLGNEYAKLVPNVFRSPQDAEAYFPYMLLSHLLKALALTWIYRQGRDASPWLGQGARFGIAVAVLMTIPGYLVYFAVQPLPSDLVAQQVVFDSIATVILGVLVAALNRGGASATTRA